MNLRPTQSTSFDAVRAGLTLNFAKLIRAQEEVSTGKRILRPSDDPVGTSASLSLDRQIGEVARFKSAIDTAKPLVDAGMSSLDEAQSLFSEARELVIQGLNGTLSATDRATIAQQIQLLKDRLVDVANSKLGDQYLFAGTNSGTQPFEELAGSTSVAYRGDSSVRSVTISPGVQVAVGIAGDSAFDVFDPTGTAFGGLTGARAGTSADQGRGYETLVVRHDATSGALGAGLALANGGADDTIIGDRALVVDATSGTVRLGNGASVNIPAAGSAGSSVVTVTDEHGASVHLDFTGWTGAIFNGTLTGAGSISLDGASFTAIDLSETDLELTNGATGAVIHVNMTAVVRAGSDLVTFSGAVSAFDVLQGIADDLNNVAGLDAHALQQRLGSRLSELDRNHENLRLAQGTLGARSQRLSATTSRLDDLDVHLKGQLSSVEDADLSSVVLEMTQTQQTLQLAQASGARLLQNTLLNYLR